MTIRNLTFLVSSVVLFGGLSGCGKSDTPADQATTRAPVEAAPPAVAPHADAGPEAEIATTIPAGGADAVWQAIDQQGAALDKAIRDGELTDVHHMAYAVRDLVAALPERSTDMSADQKAKVQQGVKFVATLAERLDASGDAKDAAETRVNFDKLTKVLADLRANYAK